MSAAGRTAGSIARRLAHTRLAYVRVATAAVVVLALLACRPDAAAAQLPGDTVRVAAGPQYAAGPVRRLLIGDNWRDAWLVPIRVPVLDVRTFAGGLEPLRRGGGNQTMTLHMQDAEGRRWVFRSIDKRPGGEALPPTVQNTPMEGVVQDHVSMLHPGGHFVLPPILEAVGILHTPPALFVMPDDPALGEFREDYAGMLGAIELRPDEGPDDTPGFGGSRKVKSSSNFFEDLESGHEHTLDEAELLRARLVDFLIGDPDRGTDQWRWARYGEAGAYVWRPIPEDRDWALARVDGLFARVAHSYYGKLIRFSYRYPSIETLTYSSHLVDRGLLTRLDRRDFEVQAERVRAAVTDDVIARAIAALPPEYAALHGDDLESMLRVRRDDLPVIAAEFYDWLATEVDVRGTDEADFAEIERRGDGSVRVRIWPLAALPRAAVAGWRAAAGAPGIGAVNGSPPPTAEPWYERVFLPHETREVRVYLQGGDDHARIIGQPDGPITLRVIAGGGDDLLEDFAGNARFYVERGVNRVVAAAGTRVNDRRWHAPTPEEGLREGSDWAPDFGSERGVEPALTYRDNAGALVGASLAATRYGFRRLPYHWDLDIRALYAPQRGRFGAELSLHQRLLNSRASLLLHARATDYESFRFHGFGNATPAAAGGERYGYRRVALQPAASWSWGRLAGIEPRPAAAPRADDDAEAADAEAADAEAADAAEDRSAAAAEPAVRRLEGTVQAGPAFAWTRLAADARSPLAGMAGVRGTDDVLQLGARAAVDVRRVDRRYSPRRGFAVQAESSVYPLVDGAGAFGDVAAEFAAYIPLIGDGPHLALRAGGERVFGNFPVFEAAFLGGRHTVRGALLDRWAGDATAYGSAELRVPLDSVTLLVRTELGVFAFSDIGRVWYDGASPGGWQSGYGAGAWLAVFGRSASMAVARGESTRVHAWVGMPF
jgi:hypothetical protein